MPFDGQLPSHSPEIAILDQMAASLASPSRWIKGTVHDGTPNSRTDAFAGRHCILGAMNIVMHGRADNFGDLLWGGPVTANRRVMHVLTNIAADRCADVQDCRTLSNPAMLVAFYNNADTTTHADILSMIAEARTMFETALIPDRELILA